MTYIEDLDRKRTSRRGVLTMLLEMWSVLTVVPFATALVKYITPVKNAELQRETVRVANVGDIAMNSAKIVKFNRQPVIVVHTASGQFKALSARCTHLGCIVQYQPGPSPHFSCNCHGSQFDINGKNIAGPAPKPLSPFRVTIQESTIVVSTVS
jgi:Rieske Fe-S protein